MKPLEHLQGKGRYANSPSHPPHVYEALSDTKGRIRLLTLLPGRKKDPLKCELNQVSFSERPSYEALSYTWEPRFPLHYLTVLGVHDDHSILVGNNLYSALLYLRDSKSHRTLWIDAVCIDQANMGERSEQIRLMSSIYRNAWRVVVWLGMQSIEESPRQAHRLSKRITGKSLEQDWIVAHPELLHCLNSRWFRRLWILQECIMAARITVQCNLFDEEWEMITKLVENLPHAVLGLADNVDDYHRFAQIVKAIDTWRQARNSSKRLPLEDAVFEFRDMQCLEPKERFFALLSLCPTSDDDLQSTGRIYTNNPRGRQSI